MAASVPGSYILHAGSLALLIGTLKYNGAIVGIISNAFGLYIIGGFFLKLSNAYSMLVPA